MIFIYNFLLWIIFILLLPYFLIKFKGRELKQRLGYSEIKLDKSIWIHAASVGEVNAIKPLINRLLTEYPNRHFIISTVTRTGQETASGISAKLPAILFPLDLSFFQRRLFKRINPEMIILVETELWPCMLNTARKKDIDIIMINGRISEESFRNYRLIKFFWKSLWKSIISVNAQSQEDAERFRLLGFSRVKNASNLKFGVSLPVYNSKTIRNELGYSGEDFIIVWGSSRPGEEKLIRELFCTLKREIPKLKLILVPRHLTRIPEIKELYRDLEFNSYSEQKQVKEVLIVDEMGVLPMFYAFSNLVIIGGSFFKFGGHNPLEAAFYGKPIIIGRYHYSCRDTVVKLIDRSAIVISDRISLEKDILELYRDVDKRKQLGENALQALKENNKSLEKNFKVLQEYLRDNKGE